MSEAWTEAQIVISRILNGRRRVKILEAGCGSVTWLHLPDDAHIVGIDISKDQLDHNTYVAEKILGDVETHAFPEDSFDAIICFDVLEHLKHPGKALASFARTTKAEGIVVIGVPNLYSLKGLITKFTPHIFHVWFYRYVLKCEGAGEPGRPPFPTFFRRSCAPRDLRRFYAKAAFEEEYFKLYKKGYVDELTDKAPTASMLYNTALRLSRLLSFGRYDGSVTDCLLIVRKGAARPQS